MSLFNLMNSILNQLKCYFIVLPTPLRINDLIKKVRGEEERTSYCRNRDHDPLGPWCFKNGTNGEIGYCETGNICRAHQLK